LKLGLTKARPTLSAALARPARGAQDSRSRDACVHIRFTIDKYGCGPPELSSWTLPGNLHESLEPCAPKLSGLRDASPTLIVSSSPPLFVLKFAWSSFRSLVHATRRHIGATGLAGNLDAVFIFRVPSWGTLIKTTRYVQFVGLALFKQ